jgi:Raf kinase inhibitor-like YbhB/YbcL family protein
MSNLLGKMLKNARVGPGELLLNAHKFAQVPTTIRLTSSAFADGGRIPAMYTVEAGEISPPLAWSNLPSETKELVLLIEDIDVPFAHPLLHLLVYGIQPTTPGFAEDALPSREHQAQRPGILLGLNSKKKQLYLGPAPIEDHGPHHYVFEMLALAETLLFEAVPAREMFLDAIKDKTVLATGKLTGTYER